MSIRNGIPVLVAIACLMPLAGCEKEFVFDAKKAPTVEITSKELGVEMIVLAGGKFLIGGDGEDNQPKRDVSLLGFVMDKYEVTQKQFNDVEFQNASHFRDPNRPAEMVRWSEAIKFCNLRSEKEGLEPCYDLDTFECDFNKSGYRLPTEAEWEFAARAGTVGDYPADEGQLEKYACFGTNSKDTTAVVGSFRPNDWGFYDMMGNVAEWCHDRYDPKYYDVMMNLNPKGPEEGDKRVLRGGSWTSSKEGLKINARMSDDPGYDDACAGNDKYGFRCVRKPTDEELIAVQKKVDEVLN